MTDRPAVGRPGHWLVAGVGLAAIAVVIGVSLLAGLFVVVPLGFVAILLRTAFTHYFGSTEPGPSEMN